MFDGAGDGKVVGIDGSLLAGEPGLGVDGVTLNPGRRARKLFLLFFGVGLAEFEFAMSEELDGVVTIVVCVVSFV